MPKPIETRESSQLQPAPELEKRTRRRFSTEYKLNIIAQANQCAHGELGQLLRRENLYSNQLQQWRKELSQRGPEGLAKTSPGPQASKSADQKRIEQLEKENGRLQRKLQISEGCLDLQKKAFAMIEQFQDGDKK